MMEEDMFDLYLYELQEESMGTNFGELMNTILMFAFDGVLMFGMLYVMVTKNIYPLIIAGLGFVIVGLMISQYTNKKKLEEIGGKIYIDSIVKAGNSIFPKTFNVVAVEMLMLPEKTNLKEISYTVEKIEEAKGRVRESIDAIGTGIYTQEYLEEKNRETVYNIERIRNDSKIAILNLIRTLIPTFFVMVMYFVFRYLVLIYAIPGYLGYSDFVGFLLIAGVAVKSYRKYLVRFYDEDKLEKYVKDYSRFEKDEEEEEEDVEYAEE